MAKYEDVKVSIKHMLAGLWTSTMFCYVYGDYFELYVPGKISGLLNGDNMLNSPGRLFAAAILLAVPALMIFLSLALPATINRILNIILGFFYTGLMLLIAFTSYSDWNGFYIFLALLESLLTAVIVWQSFRWPKVKA